MNRLPILLAMILATQNVAAQYTRQYDTEREKLCLGKNIHYKIEAQASVSDGHTPLWLSLIHI